MTIHRVKEGETLSSISALYKTSVKIIESDNGSQEIYPGARLIIRSGIKIHVVRPFERLAEIARRYGTDEDKIIRENGLSGSAVYTGEQLVIPSGEDGNE